MNSSNLDTGFRLLNNRCLFLTANKSAASTGQAVVILPPFAEEMNKTRHLLSQVMRQLAAAGLSSFMLDNYGTGDSEGDLDTASSAIWRADLLQLLSMLRDEGFSHVSFIAVRFGSLQLFDLLNHTELPLQPQQIVLWQPMFDLAKFWQQFVRIKVAEAMAKGEKLSQKEVEQQLENGETLEIAGYPISPAFYHSLLQMQCQLPQALPQFTLSWLETSQLDSTALPVQKMLEQLGTQQSVNYVQLKAEPYWQTAELASADALIALSVKQLTAGGV